MEQSHNQEQVNGLLSLAGVCEGGPVDLADNHEQYLRGVKGCETDKESFDCRSALPDKCLKEVFR